MQLKALLLVLLSAILPLSASAATESSAGIPQSVADGSAKLIQHASPSQTMRVVIGLERPHPDAEELFLRDLHTKGTKDFHHFLTPAEWNSRFGPTQQDEQAVVDWAKSQGLKVTNLFPHHLLVDVEGTVTVMEKAFNVSINNYQIGTSVHFSNDRAPQIAGSAAGIVHSVLGLNDIQGMKPGMRGAVEPAMPSYSPGPVKGALSSGSTSGSQAKLKAALKASANKAKNGPTNGLTNGFYDPTDIYGSNAYDFNALYAQGHCCNPFNNPGGTPPVTSIAIATAGAQDTNDFAAFQAQYPYLAYHWFTIPIDGTPACCDSEGTLDFEWSTAMSNSFGAFQNTSSVFIYQGANNLLSTFTDIYSQMLADGNARTMSVSWGCAEFSCADSGTMDTDHGIFNAMIGQGWSLVGISHDHGATADCSTISVSYPGSDPDLVSAGGTTLFLNFDSTYNSEVAWTGGTGAGSCAANNGGGGGGCSQKFAAPGYQGSSPACGTGSRSVPDVSLNAAIGQNYMFGGVLRGVGGTSIVAPELAGFFAQENAYLYYENQVFVGNTCGNGACAPMGNPNWYIYYEGLNAPYAAHYPFYDITSGCNSNDITISKGLGSYCAFGGYDVATGWGSFNALQLAWSINTYLAGDFGAPSTTFSGPATNTWYNSDQTVSWSVSDTTGNSRPPTGVAGFSQAWDTDPGDFYSEATPGSGNSFYSGPQFPNSTTGCLELAGGGGCAGGVSQGCHTAYVHAWDNAGSGGVQTYGPVCYDTIAPTTTEVQSPAPNGNGWNHVTVQATVLPSDPGAGSTGSGVVASYYAVDKPACSPLNLAACSVYSAPVTIATQGVHTFSFFSRDLAGNFQATQSRAVRIDETAPVTTASFAGKNPVQVTLHANDGLSGVVSTVYQIDGGAVKTYTAPFAVSAAGKHTIAFHSTDHAGNAEGNKTANFTVLVASTTHVVSSLNPSSFGQAVTFTASVTPATATGTVTFKNGSATLGTAAIAAGKAKLTTSALIAGAHSITAVYGGSSTVAGSTSPVLTQTVKKAATKTTLVSSLNPSQSGTAVTFTATVTAGATGTVTFENGGVSMGSAAINTSTHKASITKSTLTVGTHSITAVYGGNANYATSTSAVLKQVVK